MTTIDSKSQRKPLLFWGWGYADEKLSDEENRLIEGLIKLLVPKGAVELPAPQVDEFELADSRLKNLPMQNDMTTTTAKDQRYLPESTPVIPLTVKTISNRP